MTGPEHYKKAEELLAQAERAVTAEQGANTLAAAQVHASLAQVAAYVGGPLGKWRDVIEGPKPAKS